MSFFFGILKFHFLTGAIVYGGIFYLETNLVRSSNLLNEALKLPKMLEKVRCFPPPQSLPYLVYFFWTLNYGSFVF